jgi:hypothetical protein
MSLYDFERGEYVEPQTIDGESGAIEGSQRPRAAAFPLALAYGALAALLGAIAWGAISMTGFMVSIVAIGIGWAVAKAMMTATGGIGGRLYQVFAVVLTYFSCNLGRVLGMFWSDHVSISAILEVRMLVGSIIYLFAGPFMRFAYDNPFWAGMGLLILFYGLRTAWQMAAGSPGFGQSGGPRMTVMGVRR